MEVAGFEAENP